MRNEKKSPENITQFVLVILVTVIMSGIGIAAEAPAPSPQETIPEATIVEGTIPEGTDTTETAASENLTMTLTAGSDEDGAEISVPTPENYILTGAATNKLPIKVPPGRNGLAPNLSLVYNSYGGNGWAGVGWSLEMGSIQRSKKWGFSYSGKDFVHITQGGSFELIQRTSDWGPDYYGRKIEGAFTKHLFYGNYAGWEVTAKDGTKYYYGTTPATREESHYGDGAHIWYLDRVVDTNGNTMEIAYWTEYGYEQKYPYSISYSGNTVYFDYEGRPDVYMKILTWYAFTDTCHRLKAIRVYGNGQLARKYVLDYRNDSVTYRSLLTSLIEYGSDETTALQTTFTYPDKTAGFEADGKKGMRSYSYHAYAKGFRLADVNGDGIADFIYDTANHGIRVLLGTKDSGFLPDIDPDAHWGDRAEAYNTSSEYFKMADVNGDGCADFIYDAGQTKGIRVLLSKACDKVNPQNKFAEDVAPWSVRAEAYATGSGSFKMADVNGDGCADFVYDAGQTNGIRVLLSKACDKVTPQNAFEADQLPPAVPSSKWSTRTKGYASGSGGFKMMDMNGDGLADFVYDSGTTYGIRILYSNGVNKFDDDTSPYGQGRRSKSYASYSGGFKLADINGDGLPEFVYDSGKGSTTGVRALDNFRTTLGSDYQIGRRQSDYDPNSGGFKMADVNGDGMADYIYDNGYTVKVMLADGWACFLRSEYSWGAREEGYDADSNGFQVADINGDGVADFVYDAGRPNDQLGIHVLAGKRPFSDLLLEVNNSIGGKSQITYEPSSSYDNQHGLPFVVQTVSSITLNDCNPTCAGGTVSTTSYDYSGGFYDKGNWADKKGREFRGFRRVRATDPTGTYTESWFYQDKEGTAPDDQCIGCKGLPYVQTVAVPPIPPETDPKVYSESRYTYSPTSPSTGVIFPALTRRDDFICDGQANIADCKQIQINVLYDIYGNVTAKKFEGNLSVSGDERYEFSEFTPCSPGFRWIVDRPSRTWITDGGGVNVKAETLYEYDAFCQKGNLIKKRDLLNPGQSYIEILYGYDGYGNRTSITDPKENVTNILYDTLTNTYPFRTTVPYLNFTTERTYDYRYGKVLTEKDYNDRVATFTYDPLGRLKTVTQPPDSIATREYFYENFGTLGNPDPILNQKVKVLLRKDASTTTWKESHFDGLGRTYLKRREGIGGRAVSQRVEYDQRGLVEGRTFPYFEADSQYLTLYAYDPLRRVTLIDPPGTNINPTTMSYDRGRTTVIDANLHKKVQGKDGLGRLVTVEEYSGTAEPYAVYATTLYEYDPLNNLTKVTDYLGNMTTIGYDTLSRKIEMSDPDMTLQDPGICNQTPKPQSCKWTYEYDPNGNLTAQTDAKGQRIAFSYLNPDIGRDDPLNRVMKKDYPTGTDVVYTYDVEVSSENPSENPKGRLTLVSDASGTIQYSYDERGREKKTTRTINGQPSPYVTQKTYDSMDRVASITYPDPGGEVVSYAYDEAGNLSTVAGSVTYAAYSNYDALGRARNVVYGNGAVTAYTYDPLNTWLQSVQTTKSGQTIQNLSYGYDDVGHVTTITDSVNPARTQTFQYDHLNRLSQASSAVYPTTPISYTYDEIGNMTFNSQVGSYQYTTSKPHAVTQAGPNAYTYDNNGNMHIGAGRTIDYDYDNMPTTITMGAVTTFVYDYKGRRTKKIGSTTTVYIDKLYECIGVQCTKYIFAGKRRIGKKTDTKTLYYHQDHLGSSSVITSDLPGDPVPIGEIYYFPYGATRVDTTPADVKHKYTGQEKDSETALYYYQARYYDPVLGRFITPDTLVPDPTDPQAFNRYAYGRNNPTNYVDPNGHLFTPWHFLIQLGVSLYNGRGFLAFKDAAEAFVADFEGLKYQNWQGIANRHGMPGYQEGLEKDYQNVGEAKEGAARYADAMLKEGKLGNVGHLVQDVPEHEWESMEHYLKDRNWFWHLIKDIFPSPKTVWQSIKNTNDVMKDPSISTVNKILGLPSGQTAEVSYGAAGTSLNPGGDFYYVDSSPPYSDPGIIPPPDWSDSGNDEGCKDDECE